MNSLTICLMVCLLLDSLNQAVNATIASSVGAARLLLAAQQLQECREQNNPYRNSWLPGLASPKLQWAVDPCQKEQEAVDQLNEQGAAGGNQVATLQLGGAPAPQLAMSVDPVPNPDPAVPLSEYVVPEPNGPQNNWTPVEPEDIIEMIIQEMGEQEINDADMEEILTSMRYVQMWCPWGGPGTHNLKWKYQPKSSTWINKWCP